MSSDTRNGLFNNGNELTMRLADAHKMNAIILRNAPGKQNVEDRFGTNRIEINLFDSDSIAKKLQLVKGAMKKLIPYYELYSQQMVDEQKEIMSKGIWMQKPLEDDSQYTQNLRDSAKYNQDIKYHMEWNMEGDLIQ